MNEGARNGADGAGLKIVATNSNWRNNFADRHGGLGIAERFPPKGDHVWYFGWDDANHALGSGFVVARSGELFKDSGKIFFVLDYSEDCGVGCWDGVSLNAIVRKNNELFGLNKDLRKKKAKKIILQSGWVPAIVETKLGMILEVV